MRYFAFLLVVFFNCGLITTSFSQNHKFNVIEYSFDGKELLSKKIISLDSSTKLDLNYHFINRFIRGFHLPDSFKRGGYKNKVLTVWADDLMNKVKISNKGYVDKKGREINIIGNVDSIGNVYKKERKIENNWYYTYAYDSLSRLVNYTYSSCLACNIFAYDYSVIYNESGQIERIMNNINIKHTIKIYYDLNGAIDAIDYYEFGNSPCLKIIKIRN